MKVKLTIEKEIDIKEDTKFRNEFIDTLSARFAETMPVNLPVPVIIKYVGDDEEVDEEVYEEYNAREFEYFKAVIQNQELTTNIVNEVSRNYYIVPSIPSIVDDKLQFMVDLEERYYFFNIPALIAGSSTTIIKKKTEKIRK